MEGDVAFSPFLELPVELLDIILNFMEPKEILATVSTCKYLYSRFFLNQDFWKKLHLSQYGKPLFPDAENRTWFENFKITHRSQFVWMTCARGLVIHRDAKVVFRSDADGLSIGSLEIKPTEKGIFEWVIQLFGQSDYVYLGVVTDEFRQIMHESINNSRNCKFGWIYKYDGKRMTENVDEKFARPFGMSPRIGVRVDRSENKISFFLNGESLGVFFDNLTKTKNLRPFISIGNNRVAARIESCGKDADYKEDWSHLLSKSLY
jgi:hypothetical protein